MLRQALVLGEGEGHIRLLLDVGLHLTAVLRSVESGCRAGSWHVRYPPPAQRTHRGSGG